MEEPSLIEVLMDHLQQTGMASVLTEEELANLGAALTAASDTLPAFPQPFIGDVPLETCIQWVNRLIQVFDDFTSVDGPVDPTRFLLVWSWWVTVNRQARAILCLADAGLGWDAIPLARSIIEFALWSVALSRDDGPLLRTVMRNADDETRNMLKRAADGPLEAPALVLSIREP